MIDQQVIYIAILALIMMISGFLLSRSGKPYHFGIFTIHKLSAISFIVLTVLTVSKMNLQIELSSFQSGIFIITGFILLLAFISGVLMSFEKPAPDIVLKTHKITPYFVILSVVSCFYLLYNFQTKA